MGIRLSFSKSWEKKNFNKNNVHLTKYLSIVNNSLKYCSVKGLLFLLRVLSTR